MKATQRVTATVAGASALTLGLATSASADDVGDIAAQVDGGGVYVEPGVSLEGQSGLNSNISGTDLGVVVISSVTADQNISGQVLANNVFAAADGNLSTVVVVVKDGTVSFYVATDGDATAMATTLYKNYQANGGDAGAAIESSKEVLLKNDETVTSTGDGSASPDEGGIGVVGIGGITLGLAALATAGALAYKRFAGTITKNNTTKLSYDQLPQDLRQELQSFRTLVQKHEGANNQALSIRLQSILGNVQELFRRIDRKGSEGQKRLAAVEYLDTFKKLNKALGEEYYLDIMANPNLWPDAQKRMVEVRDATIATDNQILSNIRQVNASQDLDFKVALESLTRSMDAVTANDMINPKTKDELR